MEKLVLTVLVIYSLLEPVSGGVGPYCYCGPSALPCLCIPRLMATSVCCKHEKWVGDDAWTTPGSSQEETLQVLYCRESVLLHWQKGS